ncbi:hypothetical protein GN244_ATG06134 [Phytophthora infestans]|uniref:Uncharacterized protein n=1 Tax=Phytophthora infestans TaxID=4787 RepID=A0A833TIW6_PHYIN|nr:hypothetical protein GN244_ATG06134 [Phytophthora infestans]
MGRSLRAALLLHLQHSALSYQLCDQGSESDENDDDMFYCAIVSHRYLGRPDVVKTGKWSPERIFLLDAVRARRDLRMSKQTFVFLLGRIEAHTAFARVPGKQQQAPVQLQLEVFLFALQDLTIHRIAQHFGIGEGKLTATDVLVALLAILLRWSVQKVLFINSGTE